MAWLAGWLAWPPGRLPAWPPGRLAAWPFSRMAAWPPDRLLFRRLVASSPRPVAA